MTLDLAPKHLARFGELSRHSCLVFLENAPCLGKGQLLRVVTRQSKAIAIGQRGHSRLERTLNQRTVSHSVRIRRERRRRREGIGAFLLRQWIEASHSTNSVNMALGEHGTEPGFQRTAAVVIPEQRQPLPFSLTNPVQFPVNRISNLSCTARGVERVGCAIENRSVFPYEVIPRTLVASRARRGSS